ncbi:type II secretion system protein [Aliivibrio fischeri]|uniref:type II secretion system protein n=1 Tax=Aliivibrio fischeri TaxID=668 RepID=UPI0007C522DE|nr:type II secretion system protein [Aliivibrio fischeri]
MSNTTFKQIQKSKKQSGFTLIELLIVIAVIGVLTMVINSGSESSKVSSRVDAQAGYNDQIAAAALSYKSNRLNYSTITINKLCTTTSLSKNICGPSNDGRATNLWGGDHKVDPVAGNPGQFKITVTGITNGEEVQFGDKYAQKTIGDCTDGSTGCSSIAVTSGQVVSTH